MRRKLFTRFGLRSGEDPRIMWPTRSEMIQAEVEEKEEAMSLQQRLNDLQSQRELEQKQRIARYVFIIYFHKFCLTGHFTAMSTQKR